MTAVCLTPTGSVMFFLLTVLAWIYSWCTFFSYIKSERSIVGGLTVNLSLIAMFPIINVLNKHLEQTAGNSVLLILTALMILLWFNANLYLRSFHPHLSKKQAQFLLALILPLGGNRMLWFYPTAFALGWLVLVLKQNAYRSLMRA